MKTTKLLTAFTLASALLVSGCKDDESSPNDGVVIPIQTTSQTTVALAGTSRIAILAGASITNTGATAITGDMALSPGSSVDGFPPGEYT
ncbi:MAG: hypothetical protein ACI82Q_001344, partial [Nonlabens sp.]